MYADFFSYTVIVLFFFSFFWFIFLFFFFFFFSSRRRHTRWNCDWSSDVCSSDLVSKSVIADQQMRGMADVVRYLPGVTMAQGEGNRDQATIRGNNTTAGFFVDGMRDDVQYFRDLYNVERVEALNGPNAMIFGRGVGGGALNRVMKTAGWTPTRALQLEAGSYGTRRSTLDIGDAVSAGLALRFNGMYENSA